MRGLKQTIMVLMVLSMVIVFAGPGHAAYKLMECKVVGVKIIEDGTIQIMLERQDQMRVKYFDIPATMDSKMMMAIVLTAMSMDRTVLADIDWSQDAGSEILELRVKPN
jgi:hypothetical protein